MQRGPVFFFPLVMAVVAGLFLLVVFLFVLIQVGAITVAFGKLGLTPGQAFLVLLATLFGSGVNLPVHTSKRVVRVDHPAGQRPGSLFRHHRYPFLQRDVHLVQNQVVAVNVGGCIIPVLLSAWFAWSVGPSIGLVLCLLIVTAACYKLARPVPGLGIGIPVLIPPIVTTIAVMLLAPPEEAPRTAYIAGSLGTLLGADLLHLANARSKALAEAPLLSIGGAGTFDGIFLTGILAVLLA
jgi:uncharacterized membrane protein